MARPKKKGLSYFPKDVDYYNDFKIIDLLNEYGPLGQTIYDAVLTLVYREGYYLAVPLDRLVTQLIRLIGNRWIKDKNLVLQVILFCGEIDLFNDDLLRQGVITSAGIQKRYAEVTVRSKADKSLYWLLDPGQPGESIPPFGVNATKTPINEAETQVSDAEIPTKQIKENKSKVKQSKADARACAQELRCAAHAEFEKRIKPLSQHDAEQITELCQIYGENRVVSAICNASTKGGKSVAYVERILQDPRNNRSTGRYPATYDDDDIAKWEELSDE